MRKAQVSPDQNLLIPLETEPPVCTLRSVARVALPEAPVQ